MSRISSSPNDKEKPSIVHSEVASFFDQRAKKLEELGPLVTVIYQDKHPDLARHRDQAEKERLLPILQLDGTQRILDVGCGTGRWAETLSKAGKWYHGTDFNKGLIQYARKHFASLFNVKFTQTSIGDLSLAEIGEEEPFDLILCAGVLIYLNDEEVVKALENFSKVAAPSSRIVIREPMGIEKRLTLKDHYSEDMEQVYNAVYRTMEELQEMMKETLFAEGFHLVESGNMYEEKELNNRSETRQKWMLLERE